MAIKKDVRDRADKFKEYFKETYGNKAQMTPEKLIEAIKTNQCCSRRTAYRVMDKLKEEKKVSNAWMLTIDLRR